MAPAVKDAVVGLSVTPVTETVGLVLYHVELIYQPVEPLLRLAVWLVPSLNIRLVEVMLVKV